VGDDPRKGPEGPDNAGPRAAAELLAGYTYVDTNPSEGYYELGSTDVLTSGSLKIG
jgi:hypothetical protein